MTGKKQNKTNQWKHTQVSGRIQIHPFTHTHTSMHILTHIDRLTDICLKMHACNDINASTYNDMHVSTHTHTTAPMKLLTHIPTNQYILTKILTHIQKGTLRLDNSIIYLEIWNKINHVIIILSYAHINVYIYIYITLRNKFDAF